jgi:hypothetical protein
MGVDPIPAPRRRALELRTSMARASRVNSSNVDELEAAVVDRLVELEVDGLDLVSAWWSRAAGSSRGPTGDVCDSAGGAGGPRHALPAPGAAPRRRSHLRSGCLASRRRLPTETGRAALGIGAGDGAAWPLRRPWTRTGPLGGAVLADEGTASVARNPKRFWRATTARGRRLGVSSFPRPAP